MQTGLLKIAGLCVLMGTASIPLSFVINSSPVIVWLGNALGSFLSALAVIFVSNMSTSDKFKDRISKWRMGKKIVKVYDEGSSNKDVNKARIFINKHGLRVFSFFLPNLSGGTYIDNCRVSAGFI